MGVEILNKRIELALRIAISNGGTLYYNPDMYRLGFADNITPSKEFNDELSKYGDLRYIDIEECYDLDEYEAFKGTWSSFAINEKGRAIIEKIDALKYTKLGKKYSLSQVKNMTFRQWIETIVKELNSAGFRARGYNSKIQKWQNNFSLYEVGEPETFFLGELVDVDAVEYLKEIGLVDNGKCPLCGNNIEGNPGRFTDGYNSSLHFQICQNCVSQGKRVSVNPANNTGCIISLLLMPWYLVKNIFISMHNLM